MQNKLIQYTKQNKVVQQGDKIVCSKKKGVDAARHETGVYSPNVLLHSLWINSIKTTLFVEGTRSVLLSVRGDA